MYKYFNPNLIRNQELIKNYINNHCDFPTSVKKFVENDKNLTLPSKRTIKKAKKIYNRHQQEKVRDKG